MINHPHIPGWLKAKLDSPPTAGTGIHRWLFSCACALRKVFPADQAGALLTAAATKCDRPVPSGETADAIRNAFSSKSPPRVKPGLLLMLSPATDRAPAPPKNPPPDWAAIEAIALQGGRLSRLSELSPDRQERKPMAWLELLFPGNPLVCLASRSPGGAGTVPLSKWLTAVTTYPYSLVVPSAMAAQRGKTQDGKTSQRCLDNTGPRQYLVVEFDFKPDSPGKPPTPCGTLLAKLAAEHPPRNAIDLCCALLLDLKRRGAPLALAVHSGGKSMHGWFPTYGQPDAALRPFFEECLKLGADAATWTRCQLVRLPGGTRVSDGNKIPQQVHYFDPSLLPSPVISNTAP